MKFPDPDDDLDLLDDLIRTLRKVADDEAMAEEIITRYMSESLYCAQAVDIYRIAKGIRVEEEDPWRPSYEREDVCKQCNGVGFEIVVRGDGISGAKPCRACGGRKYISKEPAVETRS